MKIKNKSFYHPRPLKIYKDLSSLKNFKIDLYKKGGVYGIINTYPGKIQKQYIGSSVNLFKRLSEHMRGVKSNNRLQISIVKYGISNFIFVVYYWHTNPTVILKEIETETIKSFPFEDLYNHSKCAVGRSGCMHTLETINKLKASWKKKTKRKNHPIYGITYNIKPNCAGKLNPMFGKKHRIETIQQLS